MIDKDLIKECGALALGNDIILLSIIGEIEGHDILPSGVKSTKYEHLIPLISAIEHDKEIRGLLIIIQSSGGDCSAGLAIAEMIAGLSKATVSLVIGDSHSIAVPLATSTDFSFIAESGTMLIHPVRMSGTIIGVPQTFEHFKIVQDRIVDFICSHSNVSKKRIEELMLSKTVLTKDIGTILVGKETVEEGIIDSVGDIHDALEKIYELINNVY